MVERFVFFFVRRSTALPTHTAGFPCWKCTGATIRAVGNCFRAEGRSIHIRYQAYWAVQLFGSRVKGQGLGFKVFQRSHKVIAGDKAESLWRAPGLA